MDDSVGVHDLLDHVAGLLVMHSPNLLYSPLIGLLKVLILLLSVLEHPCELLVERGELLVLDLVHLLLSKEVSTLLSLLLLLGLLLLLHDLLGLLQDS